MTSACALVVEPDRRQTLAIGAILEDLGIPSFHARDGSQARAWIAAPNVPLLVITELSLLYMSGLTLIEHIRWYLGDRIPIIVQTGRTGDDDLLLAYEAGVDDYLRKPISFPELRARVKAILRRVDTGCFSANAVRGFILESPRLTIDGDKREVMANGKLVRLSRIELEVLRALASPAGHIIPTESIATAVWGRADHYSCANTRTYICYLRRKLGADLIETAAPGFRLVV